MEWNPFPMISLVLEINKNASGEFSLMKLRSRTASIRLKTVRIRYLSSPENAPWARTTVALRCRSSLMNLQIGSGSAQTTLKYLDRFRLSINPSIIKERRNSPRKE